MNLVISCKKSTSYAVKLLFLLVILFCSSPLYSMKRRHEQSLVQPVKKLVLGESVTYKQFPLHHAQVPQCRNNNPVTFLEFRMSDIICDICLIGFDIKEKAWNHRIHEHLQCPWCDVASFGELLIKENRINLIVHLQKNHPEHGIFICSKCPFITTNLSEKHTCTQLKIHRDRADHSDDDILLCCKYCRNFAAQDGEAFREHEEICSYLEDFVNKE